MKRKIEDYLTQLERWKGLLKEEGIELETAALINIDITVQETHANSVDVDIEINYEVLEDVRRKELSATVVFKPNGEILNFIEK